MKTSILSLTIFCFPIFLSFTVNTNPASAYCVFNDSSFTVSGGDLGEGSIWPHVNGRRWSRTLQPKQFDCCPGANEECDNAWIKMYHSDGQIKFFDGRVGKSDDLVISGDRPETLSGRLTPMDCGPEHCGYTLP
jgi:hypothetical protein